MTAVNGASISAQVSIELLAVRERYYEGRTFEMDRRVRIVLQGRSNSVLYLLLVVVALNVVAVFIDQGWVLVDDRSLVTTEFCDLRMVSNLPPDVRTSPTTLPPTSLYAAGPIDDVSRPCLTNLALLFNLLPRFVLCSIEESESESASLEKLARSPEGATAIPVGCADRRLCV